MSSAYMHMPSCTCQGENQGCGIHPPKGIGNPKRTSLEDSRPVRSLRGPYRAAERHQNPLSSYRRLGGIKPRIGALPPAVLSGPCGPLKRLRYCGKEAPFRRGLVCPEFP